MNKEIKNGIESLNNSVQHIAKLVFNAQQDGLKINVEIYVKVMDNLYNNTAILKELIEQ